MKVIIEITGGVQGTKSDIDNIIEVSDFINTIKKIFGKSSEVALKILGERQILLEELKVILFERPILRGKPLFTGHSEIITSYVETENLGRKSQKVCMSVFFSNTQRQSMMPKRIWNAACAKLRHRAKTEDYLTELRGILLQLEPDEIFEV